MIVVKLFGGIGNQMFQYAFGRALSIKLNCELFLDLSSYNCQTPSDGFTPRNYELSIFNINASIATNKTITLFSKPPFFNSIRKSIGLKYYKNFQEKNFLFENEVFNQKTPTCFSGYWQSQNYFSFVAADIRKDFEFYDVDDQTQHLAQEIIKNNSVSIHFRRGDYVSSKVTNNYHGTCGVEYYTKAINRINEEKEYIYYIFSDDIDWVRNNFLYKGVDLVYVNVSNKNDCWKDIYLMSKCKHNIIANSSFSWWGAWLNNNPGKIVIAPKQWFADNEINDKTRDLIPECWVRI